MRLLLLAVAGLAVCGGLEPIPGASPLINPTALQCTSDRPGEEGAPTEGPVLSPELQGPRVVRVCTANVLYEGHYQKHRDASAQGVALAQRTAMFRGWVSEALQSHDIVAFQEWPYGSGDTQTGEWNRELDIAARAARHTVLRHSPDAGFNLEKDGVATSVNTAAWDILWNASFAFSPASGNSNGRKKSMAILLRPAAATATSPTPPILGVINTHIPWAASTEAGLRNVEEALSLTHRAEREAGVIAEAWVVLGDWNIDASLQPVQAGLGSSVFGARGGSGAQQRYVDHTHAADIRTCLGVESGGAVHQKLDYIVSTPQLSLSAEGGVRTVPPTPEACVRHAPQQGAPPAVDWFSDHAAVSATLLWA